LVKSWPEKFFLNEEISKSGRNIASPERDIIEIFISHSQKNNFKN
jgi:hypothetical protein